MGKNRHIFTSESVTEGHPDKVCDQISDSILHECLYHDIDSRVACECFAGKDFLVISGEVTTKAPINYEHVARQVIHDIGYKSGSFNCWMPNVMVKVNTQSPDIALGVDTGGAGDQGIMFGYACDDTPELMPAPIQYSHEIAKKLAEFRKSEGLGSNMLRPDGKSQVSCIYDNGKVIGIDTVVVSTQHTDLAKPATLNWIVRDKILGTMSFKDLITEDTKILINPTGRFEIGGPEGDTGLTGRKIIVDTYGGMGHHGGGAFSGKDPTKVDRSAAYMARHIAKSVVGNGLADKCEIQLAYAIGIAEPVSIFVDTFGTSKIKNEAIVEKIKNMFDLTPKGIIDYLDLKHTPYHKLGAYGHMGRTDLDVTWEKIADMS